MNYELTDGDGDSLTIENTTNDNGSVFALTSRDGAYIKTSQVPRVARALYEAAGLPVPDLPDIPDPELVEALAIDIHFAMHGTRSFGSGDQQMARVLLAHGWGRTA